jgi:hypothetical protein
MLTHALQTSVYVFVGLVPASMFFYSISRPGKDGSPSSLTQWLKGFEYFRAEDEERNTLRTELMEQAANDKHLFLTARKNPTVDLKMPEYVHVLLSHSIGRSLDLICENKSAELGEEARIGWW